MDVDSGFGLCDTHTLISLSLSLVRTLFPGSTHAHGSLTHTFTTPVLITGQYTPHHFVRVTTTITTSHSMSFHSQTHTPDGLYGYGLPQAILLVVTVMVTAQVFPLTPGQVGPVSDSRVLVDLQLFLPMCDAATVR